MSNFCANRIVSRVPSIGQFLALLTVLVLLASPQYAYSQEESNDCEESFNPFQEQIDSLLNLIKTTAPDSLKAVYYCKIATYSKNIDSVTKYANLSLSYCRKTDFLLLGAVNYAIGSGYRAEGYDKKALPFYQNALSYWEKINDYKRLATVYSYIADVYNNLNDLDSAVICYTKVLEIGNRLADTSIVAECYTDIGTMYAYRELYEEAKSYYNKALQLVSLSNNPFQYAWVLFRLAEVTESQKPDSEQEYLTAIVYLSMAAAVWDTTNDSYWSQYRFYAHSTLSSIYINLAQRTNKNKYADSCLYYYKKAVPFVKKIGVIHNYRLLRYTYTDYLLYYKRYGEATNVMRELEDGFDEHTTTLEYAYFHAKFRDIYLLLGDYQKAYYHLEKHHEYDRANLNDSTIRALAEAKAQRVSMMEKLQRENEEKLHSAERRRMRIVNISLIGGLGLFLLLIFYIARMLSIKHKAHAVVSGKNALLAEQNKLLAEQKEEIESQNELLIEQKEEIQAQNDLLVEQKEEILSQAQTIKAQSEEIHDSINYARRIQRSLLTPSKIIGSIFPDYFILYKPRDVVSGDYYWVGQFGDNKVSIVADCTGHGVPGGFMSVLGMANLNYIVAQESSPDKILNHLREAIITNLRQRSGVHTALHDAEHPSAHVDTSDRSRDGMDVAAYVVNEKLMKLSYAGANNPLVLIRDNEVQVFKADKMPVGIYDCLDPFQCITIDIQRGDCLYTFSDGFQDQFGVETGKKFMSKRLRELLLEIHQQPMTEQKKILNVVYEEWRGPAANQTDDVVIMGVRI